MSSPAVRAAVALVITVAAFAAISQFAGSAAYDWLKALHVIAIISWMAGMLYLPRLFIYRLILPAACHKRVSGALDFS